MDTVAIILGLLGSIITVSVFYLLQSGRLNAQNIIFPLMNGLAAALLLVSIAYEFDMADLGGVLAEVSWLLISLYGVIRITRKGKI